MIALLALSLLTGCSTPGPATPPAAERSVPVVLEVAVDARVEQVGAPAAWTARARVGPSLARDTSALPGDGRCSPLPSPPVGGTRRPEVIQLSGPLAGVLGWDEDTGDYRTSGPREALDPAWAVGTLRWVDPDGAPREGTDVVRFGAVPVIRSVARAADGRVTLTWDPLSVDAVELHTQGPAGALVCGASTGSATLPWWAVPADGGVVILRSVRERSTLLAGSVLLVTRAAIERVVPLDRPVEAALQTPPPPLRGLDRPRGPRRSTRPAAPPTG